MMAEFQKGPGKGSMYVPYGANCDPTNPNMDNASKTCKTPHDNLFVNSKVVGSDLRGGEYKGKTVPGRVMSIPAHYQTQNGDTDKLPDKAALVKNSGK